MWHIVSDFLGVDSIIEPQDNSAMSTLSSPLWQTRKSRHRGDGTWVHCPPSGLLPARAESGLPVTWVSFLTLLLAGCEAVLQASATPL